MATETGIIKKYPVPMIRRLPSYLRIIKSYSYDGIEYISATDIANELGYDSVKVRKDLALTGVSGKPRIGYKVDELIRAIRSIVGWDKNSEAVLVGAGCLGSALLGFTGFSRRGINFAAAFDADPHKIGSTVHGHTIMPVNEMRNFITKKNIEIAVLTVPADAAQETVDILVDAGIKGIWNFSPAILKVPARVVAQNENLMSSLAVFMVKMATESV